MYFNPFFVVNGIKLPKQGLNAKELDGTEDSSQGVVDVVYGQRWCV